MDDTGLGVYKPLDVLLHGVYDLVELVQSAWNMFESTTTATQSLGGGIPDVCYTELFQRRYLFYGKKIDALPNFKK